MLAKTLGMSRSVNSAKQFGRDLWAGLKTLGLMEHFADIREDIEKLENLEKRLHERLDLAEKTLANAKRSLHLKATGLVDMLEITTEDIKKYLDWLGTCGPLMIRGASYEEMNARLENVLVWVIEDLVPVQLDTMLPVTNGDVDGGIH